MARSVHDEARTTDGMHSALYFWYFITILVAAVAGGFIFSGHWGGPLLDLENFAWNWFAGFAIAAAVMGVPVMVFFSLGERILLEVMDINDAAHDVDQGQAV